MFGPKIGATAFSFGRLLGGMSKTLNVVNQVIPIYKEAKPIIQNAKTALSFVKEFSNNATNRVITNTEKNIKPIKEKISTFKSTDSKYQNGPTFFQ